MFVICNIFLLMICYCLLFKAASLMTSWDAADLVIYVGVQSTRSPPTKYVCSTFFVILGIFVVKSYLLSSSSTNFMATQVSNKTWAAVNVTY